MKLHDLRKPESTKKNRKRIGRGHGAGSGKTSGKGHKGQRSRSGGKVSPSFEGGQMPINRRIPKFGFTPVFPKTMAEIKLSDLVRVESDEINAETLSQAGLLRKNVDGIKILGNGEIGRAVKVTVHKVTKSAKEKIEKAGGTIELIEPDPDYLKIGVAKADAKVEGDIVDVAALQKAGLVPEGVEKVRLVFQGTSLKTTKTFRIANISRAAKRAILNAGGKIEESD